MKKIIFREQDVPVIDIDIDVAAEKTDSYTLEDAVSSLLVLADEYAEEIEGLKKEVEKLKKQINKKHCNYCTTSTDTINFV